MRFDNTTGEPKCRVRSHRLKGGTLNFRRRFLYFLRQLGIDPIRSIRGLSGFPQFLKGLFLYLFQNGFKKFQLSPALLDFSDKAGVTDGHYFWQDLIVAQWIFNEKPNAHLDVGSRLDGFVAHLLTFMEVEVLDIRPSPRVIPNLRVNMGDATSSISVTQKHYDSVSSLHSIEHFGLGRYGDAIDINGHIKGLRNIANKVSSGGMLYVSLPIGKPTTEFNSQRILHPLWPFEILNDFELLEFVLIPWTGNPVYGLNAEDVDLQVVGQAGLYRFKKESTDIAS